MDILSLLQKYDVPTPRYTSYPTVPYWEPAGIDAAKWKKSVVDTFTAENGELSIYIHLPFCENLCTFCACNKRITKNHKVEDPYIASVLKEWEMYLSMLPSKPVIREIHLGGGTPTFFSPENLETLIKGITNDCTISNEHEFSIEVHPNYTTEEHLSTLAALGFNRISVGVQDFDPVVQFVINRIQSFEKTKEVVDWARKHGFNSVNVDLVYGLPKQTLESVEHTIKMIRQMMPDRIAFYSYAHVPWKSKVQRRYTETDLPGAEQKLEMYTRGSAWLKEAGFTSIGMDHFALPTDKLLTAAAEGRLHRNFMGYTTTQTKLIIALGASSISDSWNAFIQNEKEVEAYQDKINRGELPIVNGHSLTAEDAILRRNILDLMCTGKTTLDAGSLEPEFLQAAFEKLRLLESDGLVELNENSISITKSGGTFIRNISAAIDARLWRKSMGANVFSRAI
jgi:oxygen-independent coproporphyrinogen-3 oxidase